ncbi:MAG TPA: ABC transporter ATP-binding protein [Thermoanaerobaculia bacterium]|nr:ABC transporter ATP-binding protein [Thermoanaerobaculia bacterium]
MNVIETSGLTRRFGKMKAVDRVDLAVPRGAVYGFLGANGAGKTTTIRLLLGLLRPDEGTISILGSPLSRRNQNILRRIGSLVENPSHYPHLTGRENLEVVRRLQGTDPRRIPAVLARMDLTADADRPVRQYSLGMRQRLGLAMALLGEPELLILDEPTNGLDPAGIQEMRELVRRLPAEDGITVFLSSHLLHEVEQIATRIGILRAGALLFQGTPAELRDRVQPAVTLEVDSPEKAARVLATDGWASAPAAVPGRLRVAAEDGAAAARINARLVAAGFAVSHLALERPSLEDIFLSLTHTREVPHAVPVASPAG